VASIGVDQTNSEVRYVAKRKPARKEYEAKTEPAQKEYEAKIDQAWKEYEAKIDQAWKEYEAKTEPAQKEYEAKKRPIRGLSPKGIKRAAVFVYNYIWLRAKYGFFPADAEIIARQIALKRVPR